MHDINLIFRECLDYIGAVSFYRQYHNERKVNKLTGTVTNVSESATTTQTTTAEAVEVIQEQIEKTSGFFSDAAEYIKSALPSVFLAVICFIIGIVTAKIIAYIISKGLKRSNIDGAARSFLISLIRIILYVVVLIMALSIMNIPMSSIITVFGAAGLAISLALQNCLTNLCGGFIILFSKPFTAGDTIEIDNSVGVVKSIGILYTKIITFDSKTVFIPNGKVTDAKIINYTETPTRRLDLSFDVAYGADYTTARNLILEIIKNDKLFLTAPQPLVRMSAHNESSISIDVLVWVENDDYQSAKYNLIEAVKEAFEANNIEIPFNQLEIHVKEK